MATTNDEGMVPGYGGQGYGGFGLGSPGYGGLTGPYGSGYGNFGGNFGAYGAGGAYGGNFPYFMGYGPQPQTGYGPAYGGGWANWTGQVGQNFGPGQTGVAEGQDLTDEQIRHNIEIAIDDDPLVPDSADIGVTVKDKVVTLGGMVRNKQVKRAIGADAWASPGVHDVHNNIQIHGRAQQAQQAQQSKQTQQKASPARQGTARS